MAEQLSTLMGVMEDKNLVVGRKLLEDVGSNESAEEVEADMAIPVRRKDTVDRRVHRR